MAKTAEERFWEKVEKTETCWLWTACRGREYGQFWLHSRTAIPAHRWAYEQLVGPIPTGLQLDHLCRVPACVRPSHLEPVTGRENRLRSPSLIPRNGFKTHCAQGHEFTAANIYRPPHAPTERQCRECGRVRALQRYHRLKVAV